MRISSFRVGVAAIVVVWGLAAAPTAFAEPPVACLLQGNVLSMTTSDGSRATFTWDTLTGKPLTPATLMSGGTEWGARYVSGKLESRTVAFTVAWIRILVPGDLYTDDFKGTVNPDGFVAGTRLDSAGNTTTWVSDQRFSCTSNPPLPEPAPPSETEPEPEPEPEPEAPQPVTNAITLVFSPPKLGGITATVSNSSNLPGQCTYDATPDFNSHRDFAVPANGSTPLTFNGFNTGTTYHAVVVCNDSSGTQTVPIGRAETDVTF